MFNNKHQVPYSIGNQMFQQVQHFNPFNQHVPYICQSFNQYYQHGVPVDNCSQYQIQTEIESIKASFNTFIQKNESEKVKMDKIIAIQSAKINQLVEIANELMTIVNKSNQKNIVEASDPVVNPFQPVEKSLKRKLDSDIRSASWTVNVEPTASYNKRAMLPAEEVHVKVKPIIISSTEVTEEEVADIDDLSNEEISKMVDNAINSLLNQQQMSADDNKYFIDFNDKNIKLSQNKTVSKTTKYDIIEISIVLSNSLSLSTNEGKTVKYILIRQVFKPIITSEAVINSILLRSKLTYGNEYLKTHINGYHKDRLIMNYSGLSKMLEYIKQNKQMLLNGEYGQSLYNLLEEIK